MKLLLTKLATTSTAILLGCGQLHAASSSYLIVNTVGGNALLDASGVALDSGTPDTQNGNGTVFQLGFFSTSTANFTGTWIAIAGANSLNSSLGLHVGDFSAQTGSTPIPDGLFSTQITFDTESSTANGLPAADTQLAIRFYDGTDTTTANFNTVTHANWTFSSPGTPPPPTTTLDFADNGAVLTFEDGGTAGANRFRTTITPTAVPEPSSTLLIGIGITALLLNRRKL